MIVFLRGAVHRTGTGCVDLDVGGVGYRVWAVERDVAACAVGEQVVMHTHHHLREDDEALYGFLQESDKEWFTLLLTVSGIGPKVALQIVAADRFDHFAVAVTSEDSTSLAKLPGIGKKTAERLVLELRDKLKHVATTTGAPQSEGKLFGAGASVASVTGHHSPLVADVVEALQALGYNERQAMEAVVATSLDDGEMGLEEALRKCLAYFQPARSARGAYR